MTFWTWITRYRVVPIAVIVFAVGAVVAPGFATAVNLSNILTQIAPDAVITVGMTILMVLGYVDLSVGSTLALTGVIYAMVAHDASVSLGAVVAMLVAGTAGAVNAALIVGFGVNFFIATLATMTAYQGIVLTITGGQTIYGGKPGFGWLADTVFTVGGFAVTVLVVVATVAIVVADILLVKTRGGRHIYAIGSSPRASSRGGIGVRAKIVLAYIISGLCAGAAGLMVAARTTSGSPDVGQLDALVAITAAIIGGTSLFGGVGMVRLSALGILVLGAIQNILFLLVVPPYFSDVLQGVILVSVVVLDVLVARGRQRSVAQAVGLTLFRDPELS